MTFTDDDLKQLKETLRQEKNNYPNAWPTDKHLALVSRLEAAEDFLTHLNSSYRQNYLEAWRTSKGEK